MKYISLFSGIEAASVAWDSIGWKPVAFSEIEPFPCAVLQTRLPNVPNLGDIKNIDWSEYNGKVDIIVGGSPCQAFSVAGARRGLMDERGLLMHEFVRSVREVNPKWVLWENVPGVLSQDHGRAFATLQGELEKCGYSLAWRVLDAQFYGVAQRRRRVFLVGHARTECAAAVLFDPESMCRDFATGRNARAQIAADVARCVGRNSRKCVTIQGNIARGARMGQNGTGILDDGSCYTLDTMDNHAICIQGNMIGRSEKNGPQGAGVNDNVAFTENCTDRLAVCYPQPAYTALTRCGKAGGGKGALISEDVSLTLSTTNGQTLFQPQETVGALCARDFKGVGNQYVSEGKVIVQRNPNKYIVRRLTPTECERLQGFPDGWTDIEFKGKPASDSPRYKALGNSMAVPVMRWIGERIQKVDDITKE